MGFARTALVLAGACAVGGASILSSPPSISTSALPTTVSDDLCSLPAAPKQGAGTALRGLTSGKRVPTRLIDDPGQDTSEGRFASGASHQGSPADVVGGDIVPCRTIADPYPILHSVAVDPQNNTVVMSDSNRGALLFYPRDSGNAGQQMTEPTWKVSGPATGMMFVAGAAVDPTRREVYAVDNDIGDRMMVFPYGAEGNVKPARVLFVPHGAWGVSLNSRRDEIAISVEHINSLIVYRREASRAEAPLRVISGIDTGLADPHGVFFDETNDEIVVANHGNWAPTTKTSNPGMGGHFYPPSIATFPGLAEGDVPPSRVISGQRTGLNWPMGVAVDAIHNEIAVANYGSNSILIFHRTDHGDVTPERVIHGDQTGIAGPMGVAVDTKNDELWVSNSDDHSSVVFSRTAEGNVAPRRVLRNAPPGAPVVGFGNPGALAYDSKRDELLVPN